MTSASAAPASKERRAGSKDARARIERLTDVRTHSACQSGRERRRAVSVRRGRIDDLITSEGADA